MKVFTVIQGIRIRRLMVLVFRHGPGMGTPYLLRFLVLLQGAIPSSILSRVEYLKYGKKIRSTAVSPAPVFILGHWRTGSTYLHQLLNLHPAFAAPTMVQTAIPDHFLFSTPYYVPILKKVMPAHRPMDRVDLGPFEPQEEEFALLRLGVESPFINLLFPVREGYFLKDASYIPRGKALAKWKKQLMLFYRKISLETGKAILSKNPWHSLRMPLLREMFPEARFIHITRDPLLVVPSTIHMWNIVASENALRKGWTSPRCEEVCHELKRFEDGIRLNASSLPSRQYAEIRFEDLERDPLAVIKELCNRLELDCDPAFEKAVQEYALGKKKYRKNSYSLGEEEHSCINEIMQTH